MPPPRLVGPWSAPRPPAPPARARRSPRHGGADGAAAPGRARLPAEWAGRPVPAARLPLRHVLRPLLVAALRLAGAGALRLGAAGAALARRAPAPVRPRAHRAPPPLAQRHPPGHVPRPLRAQVLDFPISDSGGKPTPFYTWSLAFIFCAFNGYLQGRYLSQYAVYDEGWVTDPRFLTGFVLWLTGMLINIHSDHILRNLRKPGETGYKIPRGGLFEYVTAANYFGEVIEWSGFALASWSIQGMAFAVFTFCFLLGRAKQHHQWYLEKFEDYPKFRKILIPFLV